MALSKLVYGGQACAICDMRHVDKTRGIGNLVSSYFRYLVPLRSAKYHTGSDTINIKKSLI